MNWKAIVDELKSYYHISKSYCHKLIKAILNEPCKTLLSFFRIATTIHKKRYYPETKKLLWTNRKVIACHFFLVSKWPYERKYLENNNVTKYELVIWRMIYFRHANWLLTMFFLFKKKVEKWPYIELKVIITLITF